ncbi:sulfite exporter TauE/SafE family protein [Oceanobacillus sp. ISL-73]|nr:sulfite exporter TauE/SafE family protein [Oceanobacillus sp. ISL-74]MBT2652403.1 sulfite exporter TauE/SafE family protein [Oceanobacillus sp. ISL-73]
MKETVEMVVAIICFIIAVLAAFIGSLVGLGGGIVLIPLLLLSSQYITGFEWVSPQSVVAMSLVVMVFTGISSVLSYAKQKQVDFYAGSIFLAGSIPGSMFGAWLNQFVNTDGFYLYFGMLIIVISIIMSLRNKASKLRRNVDIHEPGVRSFELKGEVYIYKLSFISAISIALFVGMLSGLFGIGGGAIMVPVMMLLFGFPAHLAAATSMFMIIFVSFMGSITHIYLGNVVWEYVLFFIPGAWIGGKLGAKVNHFLSNNVLELVLKIMLILVGIRMIMQGIG